MKFKSTLLINFIGIFLLTTIPTILTIYIMLTAYIKDVRVQSANSHSELLLKAQMAIDYQVDSLFSIPDHLLASNDTLDFLEKYGEQVPAEAAESLRVMLSGYKAGFEYVSTTVLYSRKYQALIDDKGQILAHRSADRENRKLFFEYALSWYSEYQFFEHREPFFTADSSAVWICISLFSRSDEPIGLLAFSIDMDLLGQMTQSDSSADGQADPRRFYILTEYNRALYRKTGNNQTDFWSDGEYRMLVLGTEAGETRVAKYNGTNQMITMSELNEWGWKYALVSLDETDALAARKSRQLIVTSLLIAVVTTVLAALLITMFTYRPIKEVLRTIDGSIHRERHLGSWFKTKEVNYIIEHINDSIQNANRMELELNKRLEQIRSAQTLALQTQINPHFLYNTLDTIRWLSIDESGTDSKTSQMVESLAMMYRNTFYTENIIVTIKDELEFLSWYIDIIRIRFRDQIRFIIDVDPALYDVNCIKLSLQPIVENAIQHGLRKKHYKGRIRIYAKKEADAVQLFVEDDGCGMTADEIRDKNEQLQSIAPAGEGRIGLSNVNERIKLIYGNDYGVSLQARQDGKDGLVVRIVFPCE